MPGAPHDNRVQALFARLREDDERPPTRADESSDESSNDDGVEHERVADVPAASEAEQPEPDAAPVEQVPIALTGDDGLRDERDMLIYRLVEGVLRDAKRLLQDEQNELLDATRRARARVDASKLLPDADARRGAWSVVLTRAINEAYTAGRRLAGRRPRGTTAPRRIVDDLSRDTAVPLQDRLSATIGAVVAEGPYESTNELQRALSSAISARYREFKQRDLEPRLGDVLATAYARGAYDGAPSGARLRWVPAAVGQCPDADDNALEPTLKGRPFPTGQHCPPAHPGCRCVVVPTDA